MGEEGKGRIGSARGQASAPSGPSRVYKPKPVHRAQPTPTHPFQPSLVLVHKNQIPKINYDKEMEDQVNGHSHSVPEQPGPPSPSPSSLDTIPPEVVLHLCSFLTAKDTARLSLCCRRLRLITSDNSIWSRLAWVDYGVQLQLPSNASADAPAPETPDTNTLDASNALNTSNTSFNNQSTPLNVYRTLLARYGRYLGLFQCDFGFFNGNLAHIFYDNTQQTIVGERVKLIDRLGTAHGETTFSGDPFVSIDSIDPRAERTRWFTVTLDPTSGTVLSRCFKHKRPTTLQEHLQADHGHLPDPPPHEISLSTQPGGFKDLDLTLSKELWSELDLFPFANSMLYPVPRSGPMEHTGLYPYAKPGTGTDSSVPLSIVPVPDTLATEISLDCPQSCHEEHVRALSTVRNETLAHARYLPRFSRVLAPPDGGCGPALSQMMNCTMPDEGIWVGTYSAHGLEALLIRYFRIQPTPETHYSLPGSFPEDDPLNQPKTVEVTPYLEMRAYKITGDVNVPRGQISFRTVTPVPGLPPVISSLSSSSNEKLAYEPRATLPLRDSDTPLPLLPEFQSYPHAHVLQGEGTVAMAGYRRPRPTSCWVAVLERGEFVVYWPGLHKFSRFRKVEIGGML